MRIFVVQGDYGKDMVYEELLQEDVDIKECESLVQALQESRKHTEDKISVVIINTFREKEEVTKECALKVQTFGNFEVFYDGRPLAFSRAKSKELLAYLIDRRGAAVTTAEASSILWEDKEYNFSLQRQFQTIVSELIKSLKIYQLEHIIHRKRNCLSVDVSGFDCDLYRLLAGDMIACRLYNGEYMSNYSWAEMTAGFLAQKYGDSMRA